MLSGKEGRRAQDKTYFKELFSEQTEIEHWESIYDHQDFCGACLRLRMNQALSWLDDSNLSKNSMILDAGCGAGKVTRETAEREHNVFGMDYSYGMIKKANRICNTERKLNVKFLEGDIESLPFKDSSFDMVICLGVITYLESEEKALRELSRVLKLQGILILSSLNKAHLAKYFDFPLLIRNALQKIFGYRIAFWKKRAKVKRDSGSKRRYFTPYLRNSLELQGFKVLEYTTVPLGLLTFYGREIPPKKINIKITMFLEKFLNVPLIGPLGGLCIFRVKKSPFVNPNESGLLK